MRHVQGDIRSHWTLSSGDYSLRIATGGRHGNNQQNGDAKCTLFAGHFDGHRNAAVLYRAHCLMEEVCGFHKSH
jgi:hypothetical protein